MAAHVRKRSFERAHDLGERDLVGGARQPVAALDAALGGDDAGVPQLREDVLEELDRNALGGRDAVALGGPVARDRKLGAGPQGVVDLRRDAHTHGIVRLWRHPCFSHPLSNPY